MSEPLQDKMLEAVAQIVTPWCDDLETNRKGVQETPSMARRTLQAAMRETMAGELAAELQKLLNATIFELGENKSREPWLSMIARSAALLARFKELSHE